MIGEIRVVDDVPGAFAALLDSEVRSALAQPNGAPQFRVALSGGSSGVACAERVAALDDLAWERVECYFVDERCVAADAPESNQRALRAALGRRVEQLHGFHPMSCTEGAAAYEAELRRAGGLDLVQLGFGPDGHTASLFPGSVGLDAPPERLVVANVDPSGANPLERLSLTYGGIATAALAVIVVVGREKKDALAAVLGGADLPAAHVRAPRVLWLCDRAATNGTLG